MPRKSRGKRKRTNETNETDERTSAPLSTTTKQLKPTSSKRSKDNNDDAFSSSDDEASNNSDSGSDSDSDDSSSSSSTNDHTMICNYKTIPVNILTSDKSCNHTLHLYLRIHQQKGGNNSAADNAANSANTKRTLFVTNFPSKSTETDIAQLFTSLGASDVQSVQFGTLAGRAPKPTTPDNWPSNNIDLRYALVTLNSSSEVKKIMAWKASNAISEWSISHNETSTVKGWISTFQQQQPSLQEAIAAADFHMRAFVSKKEEIKSELDARRGVKDEDGFQLVTKKRMARGSGNARASNRKGRNRMKKNGAGTELKDFYRFQMRENKRNKLVELRERFNEDKERVEALRSNKKFKLAAKSE